MIKKQYLTESDHTQQAIDTFGTTYYKTRAGFMLKNGRLLDLTYDGGPREDHRNIRDAFDDMDLDSESDYLIEFMNEGNIRLIPEIPGIDIAVEPTDKQYAALKDYINFFIGRNKYFGVQFSNKNGDQVDWKEYNGFVSSAEIILDIKDYFKNKLVEDWYDDDFSWSAHEPQTVSELLNTNTLYHATYKPYWEEIKKEGFIKPGKHSNWPDIFKTYRYIYLSTDYDNAYSYAETAEDVPEELLDQIVVLEIDANKLDVDSLRADENQIYNSDEDEGRSIEDPLTWIELEYDKPIPISAVKKVHDESELKEEMEKSKHHQMIYYEVYPQKNETKSDFINRFMRVTAREYPNVKQRYAVANSYWDSHDKKKLNESTRSSEIIDVIKKHFIVDDYPVSGPSFLLPDGSFIDLISSFNSSTSFEDFPAHAEVEDFLQFSGLSNISGDATDGSPSIQNLGAVRLNDLEDNNYIELPENKLTSVQYDSLENWLNKNSRIRRAVVVSDLGFNNYVEYNYSDYLPEDIIKRIKRYYSSGHLYESINDLDSYVLDYIESNFNLSDYYSEGQSYILPDGEFLNLDDGVHIGVDDALYDEGLIKESPYISDKLVLIDDYNSIRVSDGQYLQTDPYIELPKKLPSNAQLSSLLDFLDSLTDKSVWVGVRGNKNAGASYNLENVLPEQVIKNIKRFYSSGVLYEAIESNSVFNLKKIGMSHYDEWLNSQSARDRDNVKIEIKELSPKEYLNACAEIFGNSFESQKKQIQYDKQIIRELQDLIKKGVSLNAIFLDYVSNPPTQEGRHRMYALAELYGWDKKYPVIIFTPADPERVKRDQLEKQQEKLYKYIDKAVTNSLDYTYRNYDELKDQISYYLENYIDSPEVKISERGHWLVITVNGLEYEISQDEFDWDEDKPDPDDEFDLTWRDLTLEDWNLLLSKNLLIESCQLAESSSRGETTLRKLLIEIAKQLNLPNYDPAQTYVLHHYNKDHADNSLTNLTLMPSSLHSSMHHRHNITPEWKKIYEDSIVHIGEAINDVLTADEKEASK